LQIRTAHTGITVSDVERSVAFYRDVLGFEVVRSIECRGPIFEKVTGVRGADMLIADVRAPDGHLIELLQYRSPVGTKSESRPCDPGSLHIAFLVEDIESVIVQVRRAGVIPVSPSIPVFPPGRSEGLRAIYTRDPDGVVIEFIQQPKTSSPAFRDDAS
jgi:catechol 2,3-dioxygenase-like lactoylglutathione lyase family enzyme